MQPEPEACATGSEAGAGSPKQAAWDDHGCQAQQRGRDGSKTAQALRTEAHKAARRNASTSRR